MKYEQLKKRVLTEMTIVAIAIFAAGALAYLVSIVRDDYEVSNNVLQKQVDAIDLETKTLKARVVNIQNNLDLYKEVQKRQEDGRLAINRQMVLEKFNQYKSQYLLNGLHMTVSPALDVKDAALKRKNSSVNFSDVLVDFDVTSDESVYKMMNALQYDLPGLSKVIKLDMVLQKPFSQEVIDVVSQKGSYPLIKTQIRFIWFGINPIAKPDGKQDAPKS